MLRQVNKKNDNSHRMGKYDQEAAYAWALIMNRIQALRSEGKTLEEIGKMLHVTRATVSRWISEDIGGERTTFGDMLRHAKALDIDFNKLAGLQEKSWNNADDYDKALGNVLNEFAKEDELTISDLANKTQIPSNEIHAIFNGEKAITARQLYKICKVLEVKANIVLNRAMNMLEKE
ncbi:helix-turn-helix domain-containing protein [Halodesulfovibrio sp.]|uniref:helix-turn-helix domain-containing protein n=1 Tax=Halodesulfovibrio sp. TaxID=1912772 RepID=UPI0025BABF42|nr:helix-turn-helix domain-containing protein [Halodesulfovibrio sp.]